MIPELAPWHDRVVSAAEAVASVQPGSRLFVGSACATPRTLIQALRERRDSPSGIELVHFLTDGLASHGDGTSFTHRSWFVGRDMRDLPFGDRMDYVPVGLASVPALLASGRLSLDVALIQVAPPDDQGQCSLGVSVDVTRTAAVHAGRVVAEVNPHMPRTGGDSTIPAERVDAFVEVDQPVIEYVHPDIGEVGQRIARYVARLVDDGAVLQVGLGRVPNAVLPFLGERRNLRIHSDVLTDPIVDLVERGAVTGTIIGSLAMGTHRLYTFLDGNPSVSLEPIEAVCNVRRLAALHGFASVTQAFALDLSGQVCTERLAGQQYGGVATQPDFHRAAAVAPGGTPMICLASTFADGSSAIRPALLEDEPVAIPRADVHWVISEWGIAYLHGRSLAERAVALIEIAHPDHREALLAGAIERGIIRPGQTLRSRAAYPVDEERRAQLRDGRDVLVRPTRTTDARLLQDLFFRMRDDDVRTRFFRRLRSLTDEMAEHLCSVGYAQEMAFAAVVGDREAERIVGSACYFVDPATGMADVAYMVDPAWQGTGLGSLLQDRAIDYARRTGVRGFTADVLAENAAMLKVFRRSGLRMESHLESGAFEVRLYFD